FYASSVYALILISTPDFIFFFSIIPRPPCSTLFPYTTLFRSHVRHAARLRVHAQRSDAVDQLNQDPEAQHRDRRHRDNARARCRDRKSTRLNSSHLGISYAVFCLKKKKKLIIVYYTEKITSIE